MDWWIVGLIVVAIIIAAIVIRRRKKIMLENNAKLANAVNTTVAAANADLSKVSASVPSVTANGKIKTFAVGDPIVYRNRMPPFVIDFMKLQPGCNIADDNIYIYLIGNICEIVNDKYNVLWKGVYWDIPKECGNNSIYGEVLDAVCGKSNEVIEQPLGVSDFYTLPGPFQIGQKVNFTMDTPAGSFGECSDTSAPTKIKLTGNICGGDGKTYVVDWETMQVLNFNRAKANCKKLTDLNGLTSFAPLSQPYYKITKDEKVEIMGSCGVGSKLNPYIPIRFSASDLTLA